MTEQELKQRFFAQYWGQFVLITPHQEVFRRPCRDNNLWYTNYGSYLILKNIENINDEDLKELGDILFKDVKKGYDNISYSKEVNESVMYLNMHVSGRKNPEYAIVFTKDGFGLTNLKSDGGLDYKWSICRYIYQAVDFLRFKGYLIPFMHLSIQDILNKGWARYEE